MNVDKTSDSRVWRRYAVVVGLMVLLPALPSIAGTEPASTMPYETVEQVFDAMEANPDAARTDYGGWIVYNIANDGSYTLWSITPEDHPANPAAVRRDIVSRNGELTINMEVLCQAEKPDCEGLVESFRELNDGIKSRFKSENTQ